MLRWNRPLISVELLRRTVTQHAYYYTGYWVSAFHRTYGAPGKYRFTLSVLLLVLMAAA
jgi:hypothetical protein